MQIPGNSQNSDLVVDQDSVQIEKNEPYKKLQPPILFVQMYLRDGPNRFDPTVPEEVRYKSQQIKAAFQGDAEVSCEVVEKPIANKKRSAIDCTAEFTDEADGGRYESRQIAFPVDDQEYLFVLQTIKSETNRYTPVLNRALSTLRVPKQ